MIVEKIVIENFKLFENSEFNFHKNFNLVIGVNGSGKTSLLRAISVALGGWAHAYIKNSNNRRPIKDEEIREIEKDKRFDKAKRTSIKAYGTAQIIDRNGSKKTGHANWTRVKNEESDETTIDGNIQYGSYPVSYNLNFSVLGSDILRYIEKENTFNLPLIAFYECDRLWLAKNELNIEASAKIKYSRFDPYVDCFHTGADHQAIGEWLLKHELASLQQKEDTPVLQSIRNAAKAALEGCIGLKFDFEQSRVMVEYEDGTTMPFEHLSDGQRTMLGLFCDIARRAAILNPHLGGDASAKTEGVILIDELDLHLHPKWQRKIIEDLRQVFPKIQFICTTHSPFLIQSLRSGEELIVLDGQPLTELGNKSIEDIAKFMGVMRPDASIRYEQMKEAAKSYLQLLDEAQKSPPEKLTEYKEKLSDGIKMYADNPAFQAFLELEKISKIGK